MHCDVSRKNAFAFLTVPQGKKTPLFLVIRWVGHRQLLPALILDGVVDAKYGHKRLIFTPTEDYRTLVELR